MRTPITALLALTILAPCAHADAPGRLFEASVVETLGASAASDADQLPPAIIDTRVAEALPAEPSDNEVAATVPASIEPPQADAYEPVVPEQENRPLPMIESRPLGATPENSTNASVNDIGGWIRTAGALAVVLALLFVLRWVMVRAGRKGGLIGELGAGGRSPSGVLRVIGRYPVSRGRSLVLMQLDTRVLLLDQSSEGFRTLSEITEEEEVASILMKTRDEEGASQAARFNAMLRDLERDPGTLDGDAYDADDLGSRVRRIRGMG